MAKLVDLSQPIENNMPVYPGDIETVVEQTKYIDKDNYNNFRLVTCMHAGTHIDSPMHLTLSGQYVSELPLEAFYGTACLLDVREQPEIRMKEAYKRQVQVNGIVLLYTGWDKFYGAREYYEGHPVVSAELCEFLIERKIKVLGVDMPSPDNYPFDVHKAFFANGICIVENLTNLDKLINVKSFEIMAFPLKIKADSSLIRAVARING